MRGASRRLLVGAAVLAGLAAAAVWLGPRAMRQAAFWEWEIRRIEGRLRESPPEPGGIVFTGSSSIRLWKTLARDMAPLPVFNAGFGGAHVPHVTRYAPRILLPARPRIVVFFAGGNDLAFEDATAQGVADDTARFVALVHESLPETRIFVLSLKPSPLRFARWPAHREASRLLEALCAEDPRLEYVDVATPMLDAAGRPRPELYAVDRLHLNEAGYALWTSLLKPRLLRAWSRLEPAP